MRQERQQEQKISIFFDDKNRLRLNSKKERVTLNRQIRKKMKPENKAATLLLFEPLILNNLVLQVYKRQLNLVKETGGRERDQSTSNQTKEIKTLSRVGIGEKVSNYKKCWGYHILPEQYLYSEDHQNLQMELDCPPNQLQAKTEKTI